MAGNYVFLGGLELTDTGRTITAGTDKRSVIVELANGKDVEYIKAIKQTWDISWEWLPGSTSLTTDGKAARDSIYALIIGQTTSFQFKLHNISGDNIYTVLVKDYKEDVLRRDYTLNTIFYKVTLSLQEV